MFAFGFKHLQIKGGLRIENTLQGYHTLYIVAREPQDINFLTEDFLPSIHFKYMPFENQNFRLSYYRATNKPGFLEIVPCPVIGDDFTTIGNPNLRRAIADNFDFRWEFFPKGLDQIMIGMFYKNIKGAIENEFKPVNSNQNAFDLTPENIPHAVNYGLEIDLVKYLGNWGLKGNYTYTSSNISTNVETHFNSVQHHDSIGYITEKRPLYGQAANCGNLSVMYRNEKLGVYAQLALSYTGDRIYAVSPYAYNDQWQKGFWQMDASAEKKINKNWTIFAKAHNLLNTRVIVYLKAVDSLNNNKPYQSASETTTPIRNDYSEPSYLLGFRCKFN
jgi:outer membrane receptor protein involved in Fe transport